MSNEYERAEAAKELQQNDTFKEVMAEIRQAAVDVFTNPNATPDMIMTAHDKIKAVETVQNALETRLTELAFKAHKERQHLGRD